MLTNVFYRLQRRVEVGVTTHNNSCVIVIIVRIGYEVGRQHYVDALLNHDVSALFPNSESNFHVGSVVHRFEELCLLDTDVRVRVGFLADVVVIDSLQLSTVSQFHGELVELQIMPAACLRKHVIQVASVDENHNAIVFVEF